MTGFYRPAVVSIDEGYLESIGCVLDPAQRWNGWAVPYFTRVAANRIMAEINTTDWHRAYWDGDVFVTIDNVGTDDEHTDRITPTVIDGVQRWAIGGHAWTWSEDYLLPEHATPTASKADDPLRGRDIAKAMLHHLQGAMFEYPGLITFPDGEGREWGTGYHGWHYATPRDGRPDVLRIADDEAALDDLTPTEIAALWFRFQAPDPSNLTNDDEE